MPPQENERCPEGGPELQVTRTRPRAEWAAHTLRFLARRDLRCPWAESRVCEGRPRQLGSRVGGGAVSPGLGETLMLPACRAVTFPRLSRAAAKG